MMIGVMIIIELMKRSFKFLIEGGLTTLIMVAGAIAPVNRHETLAATIISGGTTWWYNNYYTLVICAMKI
jgi:hypothetical protein